MSAIAAERPALPARGEAITAPAILTLRAHVAASRGALAAVALTIGGIFLPGLIVPYAFSDDYPVLAVTEHLGWSDWFGSSVQHTVTASGRPIAGALDELVYSAAGTLDNLRFVRLLGVLGIVAFAWLMHWALVRAGVGRVAAALVAVLVCAAPAFVVYGSWAVMFNAPWAAALGGGASMAAATAAQLPRRLARGQIATAVTLFVAALLIYQPSAMEFVVFFAIALAGAVGDPRRVRRLVRVHAFVGAVSLALGYVGIKLSVHLVGPGYSNAARSELTHDPLGKLSWFTHEPLYWSLNLFALQPSHVAAAAVALLIAVGIPLGLRQRRAPILPFAAIAVALLPLSFLPNLLAHESVSTYRILSAVSSLVTVYACFGALGIWLALRDRVGRRGGRALLGAGAAVVAAGVLVAGSHALLLFVVPQSTELRLLRANVAELSPAPQIAFFETRYSDTMARYLTIDEFGVPSTARPWVLEPAVWLILREEGRLPPPGQRPRVVTIPWGAETAPAGMPVLDIRRQLVRLRW